MNSLSQRHVLGSILVAISLILGACANDPTPTATAPAPTPTAPAPTATANRVDSNQGPLAGDFSVSIGAESIYSLSDHKGEIVVLYFSFPG